MFALDLVISALIMHLVWIRSRVFCVIMTPAAIAVLVDSWRGDRDIFIAIEGLIVMVAACVFVVRLVWRLILLSKKTGELEFKTVERKPSETRSGLATFLYVLVVVSVLGCALAVAAPIALILICLFPGLALVLLGASMIGDGPISTVLGAICIFNGIKR
jgi:hypothetical protein